MDFLQLFHKGGLVMYPLLLCSIIAIAICIERIKTYNRAKSHIDELKEKLIPAAESRDWQEIINLCESDGGAPARVIATAAAQSHDIKRQSQLVEAATLTEAAKLRAYLNYLETIVTLAPLLGLLGTVTGMISSFSVLSVSEGQPFAITGGVGEALVATATGLCVAILSLIIHTYLAQRQDNIISDIEDLDSVYLIALEGDQHEN